jgi:enoyl-CoA hydratase/carnithine racemase
MTYDLPDVLQVEADGPVRIVRLNRPDQLNATNHELHSGLAALFPQLDADGDARVAVLTGNGRAFSAGGDFDYIDELAGDAALRRESLTHGRQIVTGMVACRVRSGWAAAWWRCPTSCTWPRAPTSPIPTCWSAWWRRTAGR